MSALLGAIGDQAAKSVASDAMKDGLGTGSADGVQNPFASLLPTPQPQAQPLPTFNFPQMPSYDPTQNLVAQPIDVSKYFVGGKT